MSKLTKDDYYEIEKLLDIQSGIISDAINRYCQTAINYGVIKKDKEENPLDETIKNLIVARTKVKQIRDKLEIIRLGDSK